MTIRRRLAALWPRAFALPASIRLPAAQSRLSVGHSMSRTLGRAHAGIAAGAGVALLLQAGLLWRAEGRVQSALAAAAIAAEQPALLSHLAAIAGNPQPDADFDATLAAMRRNNVELTIPARAMPPLALLYAGAGYAIDAQLQDLFAVAKRVQDGNGDDPPAAAQLRAVAQGSLGDRLLRAARLHASLAMSRLTTLRWLQTGISAALLLLLLTVAMLFRRLYARVRRVMEILENLAARDPLTGAFSRNAFTARLRRMLAAATPDSAVGLVLFDLDRFRSLNNVAGDAAGDAVLRSLARRLRNVAGRAATVARLGADSFAIALPGLTGRESLAAEALRLSACLAFPVPFEGQSLTVGATGGTALAPQDTAERGELLRMAGVAVHEAKQQQRGSIRPFSGADAATNARRETLLRALTMPNLDGVSAWLQPVVRSTDLQVVGFEALARWQHSTLGRVPPSEFIPIAEACGGLPLLSAVVRQSAFNALAALLAAGVVPPRLSLNLAPGEFARPATMIELEKSLLGAGLTPAAVEIEITEEALFGDPDNDALRALEALRARGARLVLDDFGVGFASLRHLQNFTIDALKIDRSFIAGIGRDQRAEAIVQAIIGLARALQITTIAKGVETEEQSTFLRSAGCGEMQGYLFAAAMPLSDMKEWLRQHRAIPA